jgi:hypothetical protein
MCARSWKAIEVMAIASSELATSLALYSRTPRIRRGPITNICTTSIVRVKPGKLLVAEEDEF